MKKFLYVLLGLWMTASVMAAPIGPSFTPTSSTVDLFDISLLQGQTADLDALFGLVGAGTDPNATPIIPLNFDSTGLLFPIAGDQVSFTPMPVEIGGFEFAGPLGTLVLPDNVFSVVYNVGQSWVFADFVEQSGPESYNLGFGDAAALIVSDANMVAVSQVPVPAAAWLFGSGLIGMVGVARRKTNDEHGFTA